MKDNESVATRYLVVLVTTQVLSFLLPNNNRCFVQNALDISSVVVTAFVSSRLLWPPVLCGCCYLGLLLMEEQSFFHASEASNSNS